MNNYFFLLPVFFFFSWKLSLALALALWSFFFWWCFKIGVLFCFLNRAVQLLTAPQPSAPHTHTHKKITIFVFNLKYLIRRETVSTIGLQNKLIVDRKPLINKRIQSPEGYHKGEAKETSIHREWRLKVWMSADILFILFFLIWHKKI